MTVDQAVERRLQLEYVGFQIQQQNTDLRPGRFIGEFLTDFLERFRCRITRIEPVEQPAGRHTVEQSTVVETGSGLQAPGPGRKKLDLLLAVLVVLAVAKLFNQTLHDTKVEGVGFVGVPQTTEFRLSIRIALLTQ